MVKETAEAKKTLTRQGGMKTGQKGLFAGGGAPKRENGRQKEKKKRLVPKNGMTKGTLKRPSDQKQDWSWGEKIGEEKF